MVVILLVVFVTIIVLISKIMLRDSPPAVDQGERATQNMELQRCQAYEVVKFSRKKINMKDNPAYVEVGPLRT